MVKWTTKLLLAVWNGVVRRLRRTSLTTFHISQSALEADLQEFRLSASVITWFVNSWYFVKDSISLTRHFLFLGQNRTGNWWWTSKCHGCVWSSCTISRVSAFQRTVQHWTSKLGRTLPAVQGKAVSCHEPAFFFPALGSFSAVRAKSNFLWDIPSLPGCATELQSLSEGCWRSALSPCWWRKRCSSGSCSGSAACFLPLQGC